MAESYLQFPQGFEVLHDGSIDKRAKVATLADRDAIQFRYKGLISYVEETETAYMLRGGTTNEFWKPLGSDEYTNSNTEVNTDLSLELSTNMSQLTLNANASLILQGGKEGAYYELKVINAGLYSLSFPNITTSQQTEIVVNYNTTDLLIIKKIGEQYFLDNHIKNI